MTTQSAHARDREFAFSEKDFRTLATLVSQKTGIVIAEQKRDMVYSRLTKRLRALKLNRFSDYCELVKSSAGKEEMNHLVNAITTNLTSFFREKHHFDHLHHEVLTPLAQSTPTSKKLRIWSAGCSSGMEAYSIAMTIRTAIPAIDSWDAKILATDIDTNMLETGFQGIYPADQLRHIAKQHQAHLQIQPSSSDFQVHSSLRHMIAFRYLNLLEAWPMKGTFQAIFCRNVVIYFDKDTQRRLFDRIANLLEPQGWLYIGHSENLHNVSDRFDLVGRTIYRKVR